MEDGRTEGAGLYESNQLAQVDCARINHVLEKIVGEGRIAAQGEIFMKLIN